MTCFLTKVTTTRIDHLTQLREGPGLHARVNYTRFSHYRVAPGDRIRRPEQPN